MRASVAEHPGWVLPLVISVGVLIRLIAVNQPFVDMWSWRQADMATIARHFMDDGLGLLAWPRVGWVGDAPGYVGTEFPLVPWLAAVCYHVVGVHEWVGRSLSVVAYAAAATLLYRLIARVHGSPGALWGTVVFSMMPLSIFAGRSFMSDMTAVAFAIAAVLAVWSSLEQRTSIARAVAAVTALALALLVKLPLALVGIPCVYLVSSTRGWSGLRNPRLWVIAVGAWIAPLIWYRHALSVARTYPPYHMFGDGGVGLVSAATYLDRGRTLVLDGTTLAIALLAVAGAVLVPRAQGRWLFHWWAAACVAFTIAAGPGSRHPWYQLPMLVPVSAWAGIALATLMRRIPRVAVSLVILISVIGTAETVRVLRQQYLPWAEPLRAAGLEVGHMTTKDARVVFIDEGDPTGLYYAERRGWHLLPNSGEIPRSAAEAIGALESLRQRGGTIVITTRYTEWWLTQFPAFGDLVRDRYRVLKQTDDFTIREVTH